MPWSKAALRLSGSAALVLLSLPALPQQRSRPKARAATAPIETAGITPEMRIVTAHITPGGLRGDVSFLASDLLEGRDSPSRGLDIAAEYIASDFRRMGLEPVTGDSFYQAVPIPARKGKGEDAAESENTGAGSAGMANNVVGILRGSDPELKNTYVILSAHYDHKGLATSGEDRVFNGANDDASGTASVLEIANALASLHPRPKRSVLVILFCCEEKGLVGSKYYASHPLVPLEQTIAQINMEQMGRTDAPEGPHLQYDERHGIRLFDDSVAACRFRKAGSDLRDQRRAGERSLFPALRQRTARRCGHSGAHGQRHLRVSGLSRRRR